MNRISEWFVSFLFDLKEALQGIRQRSEASDVEYEQELFHESPKIRTILATRSFLMQKSFADQAARLDAAIGNVKQFKLLVALQAEDINVKNAVESFRDGFGRAGEVALNSTVDERYRAYVEQLRTFVGHLEDHVNTDFRSPEFRYPSAMDLGEIARAATDDFVQSQIGATLSPILGRAHATLEAEVKALADECDALIRSFEQKGPLTAEGNAFDEVYNGLSELFSGRKQILEYYIAAVNARENLPALEKVSKYIDTQSMQKLHLTERDFEREASRNKGHFWQSRGAFIQD